MSDEQSLDPAELARWGRVEELFHAASALPLEEHYAYLTNLCPDDLSLRDEVIALLGSDSSVSNLMAHAIVPDENHLLRATPALPNDPWIGRTLDGFTIERLLGRGGMGVVYLAARTEGILAQQVAIKVIAQHLQSTPAQGQFLLERDALSHSSIHTSPTW